MTPLLLAAVLALGVPTQSEEVDRPTFLAVEYRTLGGIQVAYSQVYDTENEARSDAMLAAFCGFWRVDLITHKTTLVSAGAVGAIFFLDPDQQPPDAQDGGPPTVPPPDIVGFVLCGAPRPARPSR